MPSRDANGKRLSGSAQQLRKAQRQGGQPVATKSTTTRIIVRQAKPRGPSPVPVVFRDTAEPPYDAGVGAVEAWAAGLLLRAAVAAEQASDLEAPRVFAVIMLCRELGKIRAKAQGAEKILRLRELRLFEPGKLDVTAPPFGDSVAVVAWAFLRLAWLAHRAAADPSWQLDDRLGATVKALSGAGFLTCDDEKQAVVDRIEHG